MLWLYIPFAAIKGHVQLNYLMVRNPHINYIGAWVVKGDSLVKSFPLSGDHKTFRERAIVHPDFVFDVMQNNTKENAFVLLIDKRNEQLNIPVHFLTDDGFLYFNRTKNFIAGLMMGVGFFLILFSIFLFYQMRERLYIYYAVYIALVFLYIFSDYGYSFMYFFPNNPFPADFTRPLAISLATPIYVLFTLNLLKSKQLLPVYYKWSMRYLLVYFILFFTALFVFLETGPLRALLLWGMQIYQTLSGILLLLIALVSMKKKIPYSIYIVFSALTLFVTLFVFVQYLSGFIADTLITRNMANVGYVLEIIILAFVLSLRFKSYKEESEHLLRTTNLQQEQIFKTVSDYQEKERQRYSSMLHDSVGARLSAIRFNLESALNNQNNLPVSELLKNAVNDVSLLANDVRVFSHELSPILLQQRGLVSAITEFINSINKSSAIYIQFESIGMLNKTSFKYESLVYNIVQELIQNIIKHSGATEVIVQLMLEKELIYLFVEDNGRGFNPLSVKEGLGFSQIKQLVTFVQGTLTVDGKEHAGCRITIEFPVLPDEANNPSLVSR